MFDLNPKAPNVVPTRYRQVALSADVESLDRDWLIAHFLGREAYMRTRFIVVCHGGQYCLLEVAKVNDEDLFSPIKEVRVLAEPDECVYVNAPDADAGVPSHLAWVANKNAHARCVIIEGLYGHVSFILNPKPLKLYVLDIVPPQPAKLIDQVMRVINCAEEMPPIVPIPVVIDSRTILNQDCKKLPPELLVPCRGSGLEVAGANVSYLDERPSQKDWTMLGCERSNQIHSWFYNEPPKIVDICPKRFLGELQAKEGEILTRCCLLQEGIEKRDGAIFVPWGASLDEVKNAMLIAIENTDFLWTRT